MYSDRNMNALVRFFSLLLFQIANKAIKLNKSWKEETRRSPR